MRVAATTVLMGILTAAAMPAFAACPDVARCDQAVVVRAAPPVLFGAPPAGYLLDPSDARRDLYFVNQGPVYGGPNLTYFAEPTYSESGFAYASPYPYVHFYTSGRWQSFRAIRRHHFSGYRPLRAPPYGTYQYRPAASARVIDVPQP